MQNPFGVGSHRYNELALSKFESVAPPESLGVPGISVSAHNQLMGAFGIFGVPAVFLLITVVILLWYRTLYSVKKVTRQLDTVTAVVFATFLAQFAQGLLHNAGLFNGQPSAWVVVACFGLMGCALVC